MPASECHRELKIDNVFLSLSFVFGCCDRKTCEKRKHCATMISSDDFFSRCSVLMRTRALHDPLAIRYAQDVAFGRDTLQLTLQVADLCLIVQGCSACLLGCSRPGARREGKKKRAIAAPPNVRRMDSRQLYFVRVTAIWTVMQPYGILC